MIRFTFTQPSSGIPYVNTDFTSVLQDEHIKAYGSILDGINQGSTSSTEPRNNGIILSGCDILSANGSQFQMGFTNSVIYIDGEFYQNDPGYTGTVTIGASTFYLSPGGSNFDIRTLPVDQTTTSTFSNTKYFEYSFSQPVNQGYIKFSNRGTSRYYKRVLKYLTSREGDVYMVKATASFDNNGVGFNDMEGFVMLDDNSGVSGTPNFRGRFLKGWSRSSNNTSPPGSLGGTHSHRVTPQELPPHTHETSVAYTKQNWAAPNPPPQLANLEHHHYINTGRFQLGQNSGFPINTDLSETQAADIPDNENLANSNTGSIFVKNNGYSNGFIENDYWSWTGGVHKRELSELQTHRHAISASDFGDGNPNNPGTEHENRPPYFVVVYYTKKPN